MTSGAAIKEKSKARLFLQYLRQGSIAVVDRAENGMDKWAAFWIGHDEASELPLDWGGAYGSWTYGPRMVRALWGRLKDIPEVEDRLRIAGEISRHRNCPPDILEKIKEKPASLFLEMAGRGPNGVIAGRLHGKEAYEVIHLAFNSWPRYVWGKKGQQDLIGHLQYINTHVPTFNREYAKGLTQLLLDVVRLPRITEEMEKEVFRITNGRLNWANASLGEKLERYLVQMHLRRKDAGPDKVELDLNWTMSSRILVRRIRRDIERGGEIPDIAKQVPYIEVEIRRFMHDDNMKSYVSDLFLLGVAGGNKGIIGMVRTGEHKTRIREIVKTIDDATWKAFVGIILSKSSRENKIALMPLISGRNQWVRPEAGARAAGVVKETDRLITRSRPGSWK